MGELDLKKMQISRLVSQGKRQDSMCEGPGRGSWERLIKAGGWLEKW